MAIFRVLIVLSIYAFMAKAQNGDMSLAPMLSAEVITSTYDYSTYDPGMAPTYSTGISVEDTAVITLFNPTSTTQASQSISASSTTVQATQSMSAPTSTTNPVSPSTVQATPSPTLTTAPTPMTTSTLAPSSTIQATPSMPAPASTATPTPMPTSTPDSGGLRPFSTNNMVPSGFGCQAMSVPQNVGFPLYGSLYYTAYICGNGMITFNANSWSNYRFPKPFGPGSISSLAAVAPFWSLVSEQQPTNSGTFYEEISSDLLAVYSNDVRTTLNIQSFTATWGIQVTWNKLIANATSPTSSTNTFQCQLITDGTNSYVLYRYPSNGIQWSLPVENPYLNGLGIGSPVAGYSNSPNFFNIQRSGTNGINAVVTGMGNTNMRGFWILALSSNSQRPAEGSCRSFLLQTAPTSLESITRCPCSYAQALLDFRFIREVPNSGNQLCFYSRYSFNNYAQKCCYQNYSPGFGSYLSGASSPGAGYIISYSNNVYNNMGYSTCCHPSTPQSLCIAFYNAYPSRQCQTSPALTWSFGDPHFATLDGNQYTFNGLGDFILLQNRSNAVPAIEIQARCVRVSPTVGATAFRAVAASEANGGSIEISVDPSTNDTLNVLYNKQPLLISNSESMSMGNLIVSKVNATYVLAQFASGTVVQAKLRTDSFMDINIQLSNSYYDQTQGLLGRWDGNANNDFSDRGTGAAYAVKDLSGPLIHQIGSTWKVSPSNQLIVGNQPQDSTYEPVFPANATFSSPDLESNATAICRGNAACFYDVALTNSLSTGSASGAIDTQNTAEKESLDHRPPRIIAPMLAINATVGQTVTFVVIADSPQNYSITYTVSGNLPTNYTFANGTADGNFVWNVMSANPISLTFIATDSRGRSSSVTPRINVCSCTSNGQCMWDAAVGSGFTLVPCSCAAGYTGNSCQSDLNACALNAEACFPGVVCTDQPAPAGLSGYTCGPCPNGTTGDGKSCSDILECSANTAGCNQKCIETFGSFRCECNPGYRLSNNMMTCLDIDECLEQNSCSQICTNNAGSYTCSCRNGFRLAGDGRTCLSNNPCATNDICGDHVCSLVNGQQICTCNKGYAINSANECADVNECLNNNGNCEQTCVNTPGSYRCSCNPGSDLGPDGKTCVELNECELFLADCDGNQLCQNTPTYYYCICRPGFTFINGTCQVAPPDYTPPAIPPPTILQNASSVQATFQYASAPAVWNTNTRMRFRSALASVVTRYCQNNPPACNLSSSIVKFNQDHVQFQPGFPKAMGNNEVAAFYVNVPNSPNTLPRPALVYVVSANNVQLQTAVTATALIGVNTFIPTPTPPTIRPTTTPTSRPTTPSTMPPTTQPPATTQPTQATTQQQAITTVPPSPNNDALIIGLTIGIGSGIVLIMFAIVGFCCRNLSSKPKQYLERDHELKKLDNM